MSSSRITEQPLVLLQVPTHESDCVMHRALVDVTIELKEAMHDTSHSGCYLDCLRSLITDIRISTVWTQAQLHFSGKLLP